MSVDVVSRRQERPIFALKNPAFILCRNPLYNTVELVVFTGLKRTSLEGAGVGRMRADVDKGGGSKQPFSTDVLCGRPQINDAMNGVLSR